MNLASLKPKGKHSLAIISGILFFLVVAATTEVIVYLLDSKNQEHERSDVVERVSTLRARLEGELNSTLHLTRGLIAYVATHPDVQEPNFSQLVSEILTQGRNIRNIGLAKNNIITHIFPLAGNESALGLEYENNSTQWPAVKRAMEVKSTVVAGPVNLVQGGTAFIARTPIYTRKGITGLLSEHKPSYWGLASIVIDIPSLFQSAGIAEQMDGLNLALRGKDSLGAQGGMIFGDKTLFSLNPVTQSIVLPNGSWQIAAIPIDGWGSDQTVLWPVRFIGWLMALFIGTLIAALVKARATNLELALQDPLTGLPNRRLLEDRLQLLLEHHKRNKTGFGVLSIDLDGFKAINDTLGHRAGDQLLQIAATRMQSSVRASDTVCRSGGDEFIILVDDVHSRSDLEKAQQQVINKLTGNTLVEKQSIQLKASSGVAYYPEDGDSMDSLLMVSDRKMYKNKNKGKIVDIDSANRV
ncbi:diguanylate cyclase domain-containing protein [Candidatus Thiodiazotropha endoloripes]|uniref:diguanylate cyclase domain-containing protein n=1 Tax=Candidatus Thiodiazotropha endoloripes TaxID=1818881 RepID=UPI000A4408C3|nr:diguanylate cyclase [Candidatus Thiodiazotropha endoloripes]